MSSFCAHCIVDSLKWKIAISIGLITLFLSFALIIFMIFKKKRFTRSNRPQLIYRLRSSNAVCSSSQVDLNIRNDPDYTIYATKTNRGRYHLLLRSQKRYYHHLPGTVSPRYPITTAYQRQCLHVIP